MLTDLKLKAAKPTLKPYKLFDGGGLYLHVMPNGARYWRYNYRLSGKQKTLALGVYPGVPLAKARALHSDAKQQVADSVDPSSKKQSANKTFETVARQWYAHWIAGRNNRHAHYVIKRLEADIFPEIGHLPLPEISCWDPGQRRGRSWGLPSESQRGVQRQATGGSSLRQRHDSRHDSVDVPLITSL